MRLAWRLTGPGVAGNTTSTPAPVDIELGGGIGSRSPVGFTAGVLFAGDRVRAQSALRIARHFVFSGTLSALESVEMSCTNEESWLILFGDGIELVLIDTALRHVLFLWKSSVENWGEF